MYPQAIAFTNDRCLRRALKLWREKLEIKRVHYWRDDMRSKMRAVGEKHNIKLKASVWTTWKRVYRERQAERWHDEKLVHRCIKRWRGALVQRDRNEDVADDFSKRRTTRQIWTHWRRTSAIQIADSVMRQRVRLRIQTNALDYWRLQM